MKKSDLKPSMIIEYADGQRRLVLQKQNGDLYLSGENLYSGTLEFVKEDLTNEYPEMNINKIGYPSTPNILRMLFRKINWIWKRPVEPQIEITIKVDGKTVPLSSISEETLLEIRKNSK